MPRCWQYELIDAEDGKAPGWHDFSADFCIELDFLWEMYTEQNESKPEFWMNHFNYKINFQQMTQHHLESGVVRNIRQTPAHKKKKVGSKASGSSTAIKEPNHSVVKTESKLTSSSDILNLAPLFSDGHGHAWLGPLSQVLESLPDAAKFIGPGRDKGIKPLRELTFQALKPHVPVDWRVVIFGQNPYPRLESATGIAMFDAALDSWQSSAFGRTVSMRCIIKAAAIATHGISEKTAVAGLRKHLADTNTVAPPQWFEAMLAQGILLLNAALTVGGDGEVFGRRLGSAPTHAKFWRPVVECILETILKAKAALPDGDPRKGIVFLHWGGEAMKTKKAMRKVLEKFAGCVDIRHVQHCNPAAQGDLFCKAPSHFLKVNEVLRTMGQSEINWLPDQKWMNENSAKSTAHGEFISKTQELHRHYLERLQSGLDAVEVLEPIRGVLETPLVSIGKACDPLSLQCEAESALTFARQLGENDVLSEDEASSVILYTAGCLYGQLNRALRDRKRYGIERYFSYLKLFIAAHDKLPCREATVYRGISKDLSSIYKEGSQIAWFSISSCTSNKNVACGFAGGGTLFCIETQTAKEIHKLSYCPNEKELVLAPGTKLKVVKVKRRSSGLSEIKLREIPGERLVV